jgi:hypothetical protein
MDRLNLWQDTEEREGQILRSPLGTLLKRDVIRTTWYTEGLAVLAWALNRMDLPKHDEKIDPYVVTDELFFLADDAGEVIDSAELRSLHDLEACRELLYAIHCRLRDFDRYRERKDFTKWIEPQWIDTLGVDATHLFVDADLAVNGQSIAEAPQPRVENCEEITQERHRAIIWLSGEQPIYHLTTTDT